MNVLHLQPELNLTCGITKTIFLISSNSSKHYEHFCFCLGGDKVENFRRKTIPIHKLSLSHKFLSAPLILVKLSILIKKLKIDILHSHHRYFDLLSTVVGDLFNIPTVTSVQSEVFNKSLFSYKSDHLIACSNSIKQHLIEHFKVNPNRVSIINNFVDPKESIVTKEKSTMKEELGIDNNDIVIGFVGRIDIKEKGIDVLLESFQKLGDNNLNIQMILIGSGGDKKYADDYIKLNNLKVLLIHPKEDIFNYYNLIDIVVLPSRVDPFPLVMLEAGLMKKPFIGSRVDGIAEVITHKVNGLLVEPGNVGELADAIEFLLDNISLAMELGENLHRKVVSEFTVEKIIPQYETCYRELMNGKK